MAGIQRCLRATKVDSRGRHTVVKVAEAAARAWLLVWLPGCAFVGAVLAEDRPSGAAYHTPVAVAVTADGRWVATANRDSCTVSLVDVALGSVVDEIVVGRRPISVAARSDNQLVAVASESGDLVLLGIAADRLTETGRVHLGFEPHGVAVSPDGGTAWVALAAGARVVAVDLVSGEISASIDTAPLPRFVALSPAGDCVAVASAGGGEIAIIETLGRTIHSRHPFKGLNLGQPAFTPDGQTLYFPFTYDGGGYTSPGDIRRGWVTGSRIGKLLLGPGGGTLQGLTLDVSGRAVGDVLGLAIVDNGGTLLVSAGGTHELLRLDTTQGLPWTQISGAEVMDRGLAADASRFRRLDLGGRPLGLAVAGASGTVFVANGLEDTVQEIRAAGPDVVRTISVAGGREPTEAEALARRGEAIFHDARRSLDQWYSCHSCHWEGGGNTVTFDTLNDGSVGSYKTVLPLWHLADTGPWTWHGWQEDLTAAVRKSMIDTMQAQPPADEDVAALEAYLADLPAPPSPFRDADGGLSAAATRGRDLFASSRAGCNECHGGRWFDGPGIHDVGLIRPSDRHPGFSPPLLVGLFRKTIFLHNGKAKSLRDVLAGPHSPEAVSGLAPLSETELEDLVAYLRSL